MIEMTAAALEAKRAYYRAYRKEYTARMTQEQREKRREYKRAWDKANPEKVKAAQIRFWNRKAEKMKAEGLNQTSN